MLAQRQCWCGPHTQKHQIAKVFILVFLYYHFHRIFNELIKYCGLFLRTNKKWLL